MVCSAESSSNVDSFTDSNSNGVWNSGDYYVDSNMNNVRNTGEPYENLVGDSNYSAPEAYTDTDGNGIYNLGDARNLRAYVYAVNPTTLAFGSTPSFHMPLNYRRGLTTRTENALGAWRPWSAVYRNATTGNRVTYAQPMLTDLSFDNGNLILALRDRVGDQVGNGALSNPSDPSMTNFYQPRTAGDIIRACGVVGLWTVESNGRCATNGTAPQTTMEGIGGGEFYHGDAYTSTGNLVSPATSVSGKGSNHDETVSGGVEMMPGAPDVIATNFDAIPNVPNQIHDGGIRWLNNTTGAFTKGLRLYDGNGNDPVTMGKAGGVGSSMALMADPAPIEIGNRIWRDLTSNGVQDPNEFGISGVTVRLFEGSTLVGTAVTDANGEYYFNFSATPDANITDNIGGVNGGLKYNQAYQIRLDNPADYAPGGPLFGMTLTAVNSTSQAGDVTASDSNGVSVTNPAGSPAGVFPVINLTTGGPGVNDHTFDIGFWVIPSAAEITVDGRVMLANGTGVRNAQVSLVEADGTYHVVTTGAFGYYRFTGVRSGQNVVVSVHSKRFVYEPNSRIVALEDNIFGLDFYAKN